MGDVFADLLELTEIERVPAKVRCRPSALVGQNELIA